MKKEKIEYKNIEISKENIERVYIKYFYRIVCDDIELLGLNFVYVFELLLSNV